VEDLTSIKCQPLLVRVKISVLTSRSSAVKVASKSAGAAGLIWMDNFDGYAPGASLHGMGGWKGWSNNPAFTALTTDQNAWNAPNSVQILSNSDLVHEFNVTGGLVHFRFYQYIPGNMTGTSYFIMLNQYDDSCATCNWSLQVLHASSTGLIVDTGITGASMPYIPNQWIEVCIEIDLDKDTQAYYYNDQMFYTGTWSQHVSGGGITSIGAVNIFANGATSIYYDDMSLGTGDCSTEFSYLYLPVVIRQ
jgi:hypothetical protein